MKQYIERDAVIAHKRGYNLDGSYDDTEYAVPLNDILAIPAADVRPVVLCKDCKHKGWIQEPEHGKSVDYCRLIERCVDKQFFCAAGEKGRKADG